MLEPGRRADNLDMHAAHLPEVLSQRVQECLTRHTDKCSNQHKGTPCHHSYRSFTTLRTALTWISWPTQSVAAHKAARRQREALDLLARQREELLLQLGEMQQHAQHVPTGSGRTPAATRGPVGTGGLHHGHVEASGGGVGGGTEADVLQLRQQLEAIEQQAAAVAAAPPAADALTVPELVGTSALAKVVASTATYPHEVGWWSASRKRGRGRLKGQGLYVG